LTLRVPGEKIPAAQPSDARQVFDLPTFIPMNFQVSDLEGSETLQWMKLARQVGEDLPRISVAEPQQKADRFIGGC